MAARAPGDWSCRLGDRQAIGWQIQLQFQRFRRIALLVDVR
jgi:hypothetical protein